MTEILTVFAGQFWHILAEMSPYLLFGFLAAGLLSVFISPQTVEKHLGGKGFLPIFKASLFGVPLPLCSCGVIPVAMSLRKHGAGKGATVSFLLSTPQTGIDSILVTLSLLGPVFAVFRPIVALVTGLIGGAAVDFWDAGDKQETIAQKCGDSCCEKTQTPALLRVLKHGFIVLPRDIGPAMLIGLLIAAGISAVIPNNYFAPLLGTGIAAMFVMMLVGIPVYVCATASVPIAAVLLAKGLSPGAVLVFLMTGPATNAAAFAAIWSVLGRKTALIYIATVAFCALGFGILLDLMTQSLGADIVVKAPTMMPHWLTNSSAVVLLAVLGWAIIGKRAKPDK